MTSRVYAFPIYFSVSWKGIIKHNTFKSYPAILLTFLPFNILYLGFQVKGSGEAVTQSACDLSVSSTVACAVKKLASALKAGLKNGTTRAMISDSRNRVQEYDVPDNIDMVDLCKVLKASMVPATIKNACDPVISAICGNSGFVISSGCYGAPMRRSNGVAIYFPTRIISPLYSRLDFVKKTSWGTFLKAYVNATRSRRG